MEYPLALLLVYGGPLALLLGSARLIQLRSRAYPRERWLAVIFPVLLLLFVKSHWSVAKPAFLTCCGGLLALLAAVGLVIRMMDGM